MLSKKAKYFDDENITRDILSIGSVAKIRTYGKNCNNIYWNGVRHIGGLEGVYVIYS